MDSSVETLDDNKVKLTISVPEDEFDSAIDAAFRKIAREVRIPGFRPGKAPRKVLEARLGADVARDEALRDALPEYYAQALRTHDVDAIDVPEIEITAGQSAGDVSFEATVEVRPEITIDGYLGLEVEIEHPETASDLVERQIDQLRERFGELVESDDPLVDGAYATIDITGRADGTEVDGLSVTDFLYEVGSGMVVDELDVALRGTNPGDILRFDAVLPERFGERAGDEVEFSVVVKESKRKVLPELTDEWVGEASEFDTVEELRADITARVEQMVAVQARARAQEKVLEAVAGLVEIDPPTALVEGETNRRVHDLAHRLEHQGATLEQYLEASGQEADAFVAEVRASATQAVLADLALRSIVAQESIDPGDAEVDTQLERLAAQVGEQVADVRERLEREGSIEAIRSELARGKAIELLVDSATVVDTQGNPVDVTIPELPATDTDDTDDTDEDREATDSTKAGDDRHDDEDS